MGKAIEENLRNCIKFYSQAIEDEIKHPDDDACAEQESRTFTMLYNAIKDDVMEKFPQEILDNLHGELPFQEKAPLPEYTTSGSLRSSAAGSSPQGLSSRLTFARSIQLFVHPAKIKSKSSYFLSR